MSRSIIFSEIVTNLLLLFIGGVFTCWIFPGCLSLLFYQWKMSVEQETIQKSEFYVFVIYLLHWFQEKSWVNVLCIKLYLCFQPCIIFLNSLFGDLSILLGYFGLPQDDIFPRFAFDINFQILPKKWTFKCIILNPSDNFED